LTKTFGMEVMKTKEGRSSSVAFLFHPEYRVLAGWYSTPIYMLGMVSRNIRGSGIGGNRLTRDVKT